MKINEQKLDAKVKKTKTYVRDYQIIPTFNNQNRMNALDEFLFTQLYTKFASICEKAIYLSKV